MLFLLDLVVVALRSGPIRAEVFSFREPSRQCMFSLNTELSESVEDAASGLLLEKGSIMICGGKTSVYETSRADCFILKLNDNTITSSVGHLTKPRYLAASIVIDDMLWITGGCICQEFSFSMCNPRCTRSTIYTSLFL